MSPDAAPDYLAAPSAAENQLAPSYTNGSSTSAPPQAGGSASGSGASPSGTTTFEFKEFKIVFAAPGDNKSLWLTPRQAGKGGAQLDGEIILADATKAPKEVVIGLSGTVNFHTLDIRAKVDADKIYADKSFFESPYDAKSQSVMFHKDRSVVSKANIKPSEPIPFSLSLPATYPSEVWPGRPLPPSCQMEDHGVRYYVKATVTSGGLFSKKRVDRYVPVIYAPLDTVDFLAPARLAARSSGGSAVIPGPAEDKESWLKKTEEFDGKYYANVFLANPSLFVRGEEVDFYLRIDCPSGGAGGFPLEQIVAELRVSQEWTHLDDDILGTATLTAVDSSLLPSIPEEFSETHQPACFRGVVPISASVTPSFKIRQLQQSHSLRVTLWPEQREAKGKDKLKNKQVQPLVVVKVPLTILNVGNEKPYVIEGKYCNQDALGAMLMQGKDPIERM